jgi:hypothetical protein
MASTNIAAKASAKNIKPIMAASPSGQTGRAGVAIRIHARSCLEGGLECLGRNYRRLKSQCAGPSALKRMFSYHEAFAEKGLERANRRCDGAAAKGIDRVISSFSDVACKINPSSSR